VFVQTSEDRMVAVGRSVVPGLWRAQFDELMGSVAGRFARVEPRAAARAFVEGLPAPIERKNCWWPAEHAGRGGPQAMQRLLRTGRWDADGVRDGLRLPSALFTMARCSWPVTEPIRAPPDQAGRQRQSQGGVDERRNGAGDACAKQ
jgi:hypothetical protein